MEWEPGGGMSALGAAGPLLRGLGSAAGKVLQGFIAELDLMCLSCPLGRL